MKFYKEDVYVGCVIIVLLALGRVSFWLFK